MRGIYPSHPLHLIRTTIVAVIKILKILTIENWKISDFYCKNFIKSSNHTK